MIKYIILFIAIIATLQSSATPVQKVNGRWFDIGGKPIVFKHTTRRDVGERVWVYNTKTKRAIVTVITVGKDKNGRFEIYLSGSDKAYLLVGRTKYKLRIKVIN